MKIVSAFDMLILTNGDLNKNPKRDSHYAYLEMINDCLDKLLEYTETHTDKRAQYIRRTLLEKFDYINTRLQPSPQESGIGCDFEDS